MATSALCLSSQLRRPLPDVVVVRTTVFGWAIDRAGIDARISFQASASRRTTAVALTGAAARTAPDQVLRHGRGAYRRSSQVSQGQRIVDSHVELDEAADDPVLLASVVPLEQEQLVPLQRGRKAGPTSATLWMGQAHLDGVPDRRQIVPVRPLVSDTLARPWRTTRCPTSAGRQEGSVAVAGPSGKG